VTAAGLLRELSVLVVDDEEDVRRGIERLVRGAGATVAGAASGEAALAWLAGNEVDLVLTDVRMPGLSGLDLLREVRARWPHAEVVLISGFGTIETAVACLQAGRRTSSPSPSTTPRCSTWSSASASGPSCAGTSARRAAAGGA
jgi:DNA-binding NtrC family response regulator